MAVAAAIVTLAPMVDQMLPLIAYGWMTGVGTVLAAGDAVTHRLPDRLTALLLAGCAAPLSLHALIYGEGARLAEAIASGVAAMLFYLLLWVLTRGGVGLGDAKLVLGLGLTVGWAGWTAAASAVFLGLLLTAPAALALMAFTDAGRKDSLPHAPFMLLAAITTVILTSG